MVDTKKAVENILGKKKYPERDRDGDGLVDRLDCQPDNPLRQDSVNPAQTLRRWANKKVV